MADLVWNGDAVARRIEEARTEAARMGAEFLRDEAVQRTPIETGTPRLSAKVTAAKGEAAVSYNTPYAARQHEELGWRHAEGEAKFLENAMVASQRKILGVIASEIGKAL